MRGRRVSAGTTIGHSILALAIAARFRGAENALTGAGTLDGRGISAAGGIARSTGTTMAITMASTRITAIRTATIAGAGIHMMVGMIVAMAVDMMKVMAMGTAAK